MRQTACDVRQLAVALSINCCVYVLFTPPVHVSQSRQSGPS